LEFENVKQKLNNCIKNNNRFIIITDTIDRNLTYIAKELCKSTKNNNKECINIFCTPFKFFGEKHVKDSNEFKKEFLKYGTNNYYFDCNSLIDKIPKNAKLNDVLHIVYKTLFEKLNRILFK